MQMEMKRARAAILISDKIDFKTKTALKDKEGHYIMVKWPSIDVWRKMWYIYIYTHTHMHTHTGALLSHEKE